MQNISVDIFHPLILASVLSYNILSSFPSAVCVVASEDYFYWLIKNNQPMRIFLSVVLCLHNNVFLVQHNGWLRPLCMTLHLKILN